MAASERLRFPVGFNRFTVGYLLEHDLPPEAPPVPRPLAAFCAGCWGAGAIWEPGPFGLLPVACPTCRGSRQAPSPGGAA